MKKKLLLFSFLLLPLLFIFSQIPTGYYNSAVGKKQADLKTALHLIIMNANPPSYGSGSGSTWAAFATTDVRPEDRTVWDMYSSNHVAFSGTSAASGMNIEHSLANSWWGGTKNQTYNDLFNLNPSNSTANSSKGSWPIAVVDGTVSYSNGVIKVGKSGSRPGGTIDAWEPADEYKGDFARSYMYMVTSYEDFSSKWTGNSVNQLDNNTYPVFEQWTVDLFLKWCAQDPVSQKEIDRNNAVYKIQGNRNPYIDYPLMAEYVWGKLIDVPFDPNGNSTIPYLTSPSSGTLLNFGQVAYQQTDTASVYIKGLNITGDLALSLSGTNAADFSLPVSTVTQSAATTGFKLIINFSTQSLGARTATLTISGGGITITTVTLNATSTDSFLALNATDITSGGFTANWTASSGATGYSLNLYSLTGNTSAVPQTLLVEDFTSGVPATWAKSGYTDTSLADNIKMGSGSQAGQIATPSIDMSKSTTVMVRGKQYSTDNGAKLIVRVNGDSITAFVTAVDNQDFTVNVPAKTATSTVSISVAAGSGNRAYVDYVKISTQGIIQTPVPVNGYPKLVGNMLSYLVSGLVADSTYFYSVSPQGNSTGVSNVIQIRTAFATNATQSVNDFTINWQMEDNILRLMKLPENAEVNVFDLVGKKLFSTHATGTGCSFTLPMRGIYFVQIHDNLQLTTCKIRF